MSQAFDVDPYAPPQAPVVAPPVTGDADFPRISTWWVFLLFTVTLGLYGPYWMYTRGKTLNAIMCEEVFPLAVPATVAVLCASDILMNIVISFGDGMWMVPFWTAVHWFAIIVNLICVFSFRNRLREYAAAHSAYSFRAGSVSTFFLQVLYLNYKVNELIDARSTDHAQAASPSRLAQQHG